jgi:hypothetical protein
MKLSRLFFSAAAFVLVSGSAFASGHAHYGVPVTAIANAKTGQAAIPLTVTNNTDMTLGLTLTQANGSRDKMPLQPVSDYPYNVVSIDNPSWPVQVKICNPTACSSVRVFPQNPNVNINPSNTQSPLKGVGVPMSITMSSIK